MDTSNLDNSIINSSLIANLRHDLRTPINAILGYSEMLLEDISDLSYSECQLQDLDCEGAIALLSSIHNHGKVILAKINQLLVDDNSTVYRSMIQEKIVNIKLESNPLIEIILNDCNQLKNKENNEEFLDDIERINKSAIRLKEYFIDIEKLIFISASSDHKITSNTPVNEFITTKYPKLTEAKKDNITGHILVVDDNENNRDLLSSLLLKEGHTVTLAINGLQALEMIIKDNYDLILLDLLMPEIDGYQVLENIKNNDKKKHIPIIMISALDELDNVIRCIEIGAEDFLPKPFNKVLLHARITACLEKKILRDREIEYLAKLNKELDTGREMQLNFLPSEKPQIHNWQIASFFKPARQVAGDFYDVFQIKNDQLVLVLADVCDKGVGAALFMGLFRSLIRIFSQQQHFEGDRIEILNTHQPLNNGWIGEDNDINFVHLNALQAISLTNDYIADNHGDLGMFATMFVGILDPQTGLLSYINGGHETLIVIDEDNKIKHKLESTGAAVGMMPNMNFSIQQIYLDFGDTLFGNTDGVIDARSVNKEFFRQHRLEAILHQPFSNPQELLGAIKQQLLQHIGMADQFDDITMLAVKRGNFTAK